MENNLDTILKQFSKLREEENAQNVKLTGVKSDLTNVKTSMTSLSASLLNLKSQVASNYEMDQKVSIFLFYVMIFFEIQELNFHYCWSSNSVDFGFSGKI